DRGCALGSASWVWAEPSDEGDLVDRPAVHATTQALGPNIGSRGGPGGLFAGEDRQDRERCPPALTPGRRATGRAPGTSAGGARGLHPLRPRRTERRSAAAAATERATGGLRARDPGGCAGYAALLAACAAEP